MRVNIVVAASENQVIGRDNKLLWHLPIDLAYFKNITWGMPVIMGRKTYESMGKPLKGRTNIVISRQARPPALPEEVGFAGSFDAALRIAADTDALEAYVIGGGEIYRQVLPLAHTIFLTRVLACFDGDSFFPVIDEDEWTLAGVQSFDTDSRHAYPYRFETWQRK